jgi:hypothetical protein
MIARRLCSEVVLYPGAASCDFEAAVEDVWKSAAADQARAMIKRLPADYGKISARCLSGYERTGLQDKSRQLTPRVWLESDGYSGQKGARYPMHPNRVGRGPLAKIAA